MLTCVPRVRLWTYQALTVDNSADRTDGKERSRLRPTEPSGIRSAALSIERANQQSVALCDLTK